MDVEDDEDDGEKKADKTLCWHPNAVPSQTHPNNPLWLISITHLFIAHRLSQLRPLAVRGLKHSVGAAFELVCLCAPIQPRQGPRTATFVAFSKFVGLDTNHHAAAQSSCSSRSRPQPRLSGFQALLN